jgi:hypothetical protein
LTQTITYGQPRVYSTTPNSILLTPGSSVEKMVFNRIP